MMSNPLVAKILDPWRQFKWSEETVPEWDNAKVRVRAMRADDWLEYNRRATELQPPPAEGETEAPPVRPDAMNQLNAFVLVRVLFGEDGERLLSDEQVPELAANYGPVYDNLVAKAFDLSGLQAKAGADPVVEAGND